MKFTKFFENANAAKAAQSATAKRIALSLACFDERMDAMSYCTYMYGPAPVIKNAK